MTTHEHRWNTVVATGKWAETDWQVLGCECGAVTVRPRISSDQAGFWEVDPQGSFRAVQPIVVGQRCGPAADEFDTTRFKVNVNGAPGDSGPGIDVLRRSAVGGTWSARER